MLIVYPFPCKVETASSEADVRLPATLIVLYHDSPDAGIAFTHCAWSCSILSMFAMLALPSIAMMLEVDGLVVHERLEPLSFWKLAK